MGERPSPKNSDLWVLLLLAALADSILSFFWFEPWLRVLVFLFGMVLPILLWVRRVPGLDQDGTQRDPFPPPPPWAWVLLLGTGITLRWVGIQTLSVWPTGDEGLKGMAAWALAQRWDWRFFYTVGQNPPAFIWLLAGLFKLQGPPLFALWAASALVSSLNLLATAWVLRSFTSRSFAFLGTALMAFSYWPLAIGRRCLPAVTPPLTELLLVLCLILFHKDKRRRDLWALGAGALAGLQSFTYVSWPVIFLAGAILFLYSWGRTGEKGPRLPAIFTLGALLGLFPFLAALVHEGYGQHILGLTEGSHWFKYGGFLERCHRYGEALLFRSGGREGELGGAGGLLNPLLGPLFLLGCAQVFLSRRKPFYAVLGSTFLLFLLPGILSLNLQTYRVIQLLPLLLGVTALGAARLAQSLPPRILPFVLVVLLLGSTSLDLAKWTQPWRRAAKDPASLEDVGKSSIRYRTFLDWKEEAGRSGPGILLSEWDPGSDRTLCVACRPFNACFQGEEGPEGANWMGILLESHYGPYLKKAFPGARWRGMGRAPDGRVYLLGYLDLRKEDPARARRWGIADRAFRSINWAVDHLYDEDVLDRMDTSIRRDYPLVQGDRLLESLYWERVADFYYAHGGRTAEHLRALELAVDRGVPAPHLVLKRDALRSLLGRGKGP